MKNFIIITLSFWVISSCNTGSNPESSELIGHWLWLESTGGIAGITVKASEAKYTKSYDFTADSFAYSYHNDSLLYRARFQTEGNELNIGGLPFVMQYRIENDQLVLTEQCVDCFVHIYKRNSEEFIIIRDNLDLISPGDPTTIKNININDDKMTLKIQYGGGCKEHEFKLYSNAAFMESYPVQVSIGLYHDADNDACEALITKEIRFDLTPLQELYKKYYGKNGTIKLNIHTADNEYYSPAPLYTF